MPTLFTHHKISFVKDKEQRELFFYLLILTSFLFLLEISFFIQSNKAYFSDFTLVSSQLNIPLSILPGIIYFVLVQIAIHLGFCLYTFAISSLVSSFFLCSVKQKINVAIVFWIIELLTILTANQYFFPQSKFSELTSLILFSQMITFYCLLFFIIVNGIFVLLAIMSVMKWFIQLKIFIKIAMFLGVIFMLFGISFFLPIHSSHVSVATEKKPNIIIVGVDSLRPDFLSFFGHDNATPFIDSLLAHATVFNEALTPLARTFPSWVSILTGAYPKQTGVRFNLALQNHLDLSNTLAAILKRHGYETMYAIDETRFSNIDETFGFDQIISPPIGLNDFLLGTFNDFPLSNLLVNTWIGYYLFPYSYANRGAYVTYDPNHFLNLLNTSLKKERHKPLFLTVHFCLPHYPYLWSTSPKNQTYLERYNASIIRIDIIMRDFFAILNKNHLLDHAILVLLSDHGEALALEGDRITESDAFFSSDKKKSIPKFYPESLDHEAINQTAGHGTDVLGLSQYHTLLAFRLYGMGKFHPANVSGLVSLLDIKPTILDLIGFSQKTSSLSHSLAEYIKQGTKKQLISQPIFLETDYTPEAIRTIYPEVRQVLLEGVQLFHIDPKTTRLTIKPAMGEMIIKSKQYAVIDGEWMLALYPQNKTTRMPILINLKTGLWTNDLHSTLARQSNAKKLIRELKLFYGNEISEREL